MNKVLPHSLFTEFDIELFRAGKHYKLYNKFGCHAIEKDGQQGLYFAVFAPAARAVEVIGDFNAWSGDQHALSVRWDSSGIWEGFIPDLEKGLLYKYRLHSNHDDKVREKADPFAFSTELMPKSASVQYAFSHRWSDKTWMNKRSEKNALNAPISIYELHIGSWKKKEGYSLSYREMADTLVPYLKKMNFTHVEFLPLTEHPYFPSWGYLTTSYFAPSSRYGNPDELMYLIDALHQADIGVLMDWVPAHFPNDEFALADFDGSALYEHPDRKKGFHPDWNSLIFNFERNEIRSFLLSSAHFWLDKYHIDGLRVDAVSSMLYLDYSREEGEWDPNEYGGNEYLAAVSFLKELNTTCYAEYPDIIMIAEESTAYTGVTKPVHHGGLGFGLKWMMGWMNDTLRYMAHDPVHRKYHHNDISFSMAYAYSENYVLPLSHDEVVHGKKSLVYKMPGDEWQKFANLRLLYAYMYAHPGHKLLFMGDEFGQTSEWEVDAGLDWGLLAYDPHMGVQKMVARLNHLYKNEPAFSQHNFSIKGFEWIDHNDAENCVLLFLRKADEEQILVACNFTPQLLENYSVGVEPVSSWEEIFNSDSEDFWGSGQLNGSRITSQNVEAHGRPHSIKIRIPPLAAVYFKRTAHD